MEIYLHEIDISNDMGECIVNEKIYYHYCSVDTFFNIMQTSTLRLGNPLSMNDSAEIIWFLELVEKYVDQKGIYREISEKWELVEKMMKSIIHEIDFPYILCLSKSSDVLSQWRSYANDGKGVAIGIDVDVLLRYSNLLSGNEIIYNSEEQMKLLGGKGIDKPLGELNRAIINDDEATTYNKIRILVSYLLEDAVKCKNPAFSEEDEYRISCVPNKSDEGKISEIKFRINNEVIFPYREICFGKIKHNLIKGITIGPKSLINNRNLCLFLKQQGFKWEENKEKWNQHVKTSKATYR